MASLAIEKCLNHPECNVQYVYFAQTVTKVCKTCANLNPKHVLPINNFATIILQNFSKFQRAQKESFRRHEQLSQIISNFKQQYSKVENETMKQLLKIIEQENRRFKDEYLILQKSKKKLNELSKLLQYFEALKDKDLMDIKLNLSSQAGLKYFFKKYNLYTSIIKKKNYEQYMKIQKQIKDKTQRLQQLQNKSIVRFISQYLLNQNKQMQNNEKLNLKEQKQPKNLYLY